MSRLIAFDIVLLYKEPRQNSCLFMYPCRTCSPMVLLITATVQHFSAACVERPRDRERKRKRQRERERESRESERE